MNPTDLITLVQPTEGWYAVLGIKDKSTKQELVATREELDALAAEYVKDKRNVFFGVARYATPDSRKKENVLSLKSFWLDIDCGESKAEVNKKTGKPDGYIDQKAGLEALQKFCKTIGLPKPTLVNSGRGLHVYWVLTESISPTKWETAAKRFRELCNIHEFYIDNAVFETARILRVPGTYNFKDPTPKLVEVMSTAEPIEFKEFHTLLGIKDIDAATPRPKRAMTALGMSMLGNVTSSFSKIMVRSGKGTGCAQLLDCYQNRVELSETRWFNALSIAKFCSDRDAAVHKLSSDHPDYDYDNVEQKISHIAGPHSCKEFEKNNTGGCEDCPHKGKITTPIALGKELAPATPEDSIVVEELEGDEPDEVHKIPAYPEPFFRGKNGGIYYVAEDDEAEPIQVYENDLYVVKRMNDPDLGDVIVLRLHLPRDGVKEFVISNVQISDKSELRKTLAKQGAMFPEKKFGLMTLYLHAAIKELQFRRKAEMMRTQFGWADGDAKFIIGDREVTHEGIFHSPPSNATEELAGRMDPVGSLEKWKEVFNLYGTPGLEPHAFGALAAFGSPLFKFTGHSGCIMNVIHPHSGTGKSTILYMANSVFGHPKGLCAIFKDTMNSKMHRLGVMNNLTYTLDEITNTKPAEFSDLIYSMSQGRGKDRMNGNTNSLRKNTTSWACMSLCSSNASFYEKLAALKDSPDGELMRLLEYKIEHVPNCISPETAKKMFDHQLEENYGWAGEIYAEWLVNNLEAAKKILFQIQRKIDTELKLTSRERFWSAALASNIAGGVIAKDLGLIDWDMKAIYAWATTMLKGLRLETEAPSTNSVMVVGDFINRHMQNTLVVNDGVDQRTSMPTLPLMEPKGDLIIRYEPDTKSMFISAKEFKKDCVERQANYRETLNDLTKMGIFKGAASKRLSKGMKMASPGVHCIELDCSVTGFLDVGNLTGVEADASGER